MSLKVRFALFTSLLCILLIGGITVLLYHFSYKDLEYSMGQRLEAIVRSGAIQIDGTLHDQIKSNDDVGTEAFIAIRDHLLALKKANQLETEIYTLRRTGEKLEFVVMTNRKPYVGDTYTIRREMLPTLNKGIPARTGVYHDTHGSWISAYAPIFDRDGQISGLLEADYEMDTFLAYLRDRFMTLLLAALVFSVLAIILSISLAHSITARLTYLIEMTEKISLGSMDTAIEIKGRDEVAVLGQSLERMRESLVLAAKMLD